MVAAPYLKIVNKYIYHFFLYEKDLLFKKGCFEFLHMLSLFRSSSCRSVPGVLGMQEAPLGVPKNTLQFQ